VVGYLALQVMSGWVIYFAIGWCLIEIWRGPGRAPSSRRKRRTRRGAEPVATWLELEHAPARRRCLPGTVDQVVLGLRAA
jgi:hypothetical protein